MITIQLNQIGANALECIYFFLLIKERISLIQSKSFQQIF